MSVCVHTLVLTGPCHISLPSSHSIAHACLGLKVILLPLPSITFYKHLHSFSVNPGRRGHRSPCPKFPGLAAVPAVSMHSMDDMTPIIETIA